MTILPKLNTTDDGPALGPLHLTDTRWRSRPETRMLLSPQDIARRIAHKHRSGWVTWYGLHTRHYWALATWVPTPDAMIEATTPDALDAAITTFEALHPKPRHRHAHAMNH